MSWRLAKALMQMRDQFNAAVPRRNKSHDGTIGDAAHASRNSDHNPWVKDGSLGVVTALDITHDPRNGVDIAKIAERLRSGRDSRIKYVIANKRIFSSTQNPWQWRSYTGSNPHTSHIHVSVNSHKAAYDDTREWGLFDHSPQPDPEAPSVPGPDRRPLLKEGSRGEEVREVQGLLDITIDGIFGPNTKRAVRNFQLGVDLDGDGIVGPLTWAALDRLERQAVEEDETSA